VRYRLDVRHRVELLGWELADNFGVLCYNFAGAASLTKQFLAGTNAFFDTLKTMFKPGDKNWYNESHEVRLAAHFEAPPYKLDSEVWG
jgi:hypothetical protein